MVHSQLFDSVSEDTSEFLYTWIAIVFINEGIAESAFYLVLVTMTKSLEYDDNSTIFWLTNNSQLY